MAMSEESKRSSIPPWPGRMLPLSLIPIVRLKSDSTRSPHVPNTTTTSPKPNHCGIERLIGASDWVSNTWEKFMFAKERPRTIGACVVGPKEDKHTKREQVIKIGLVACLPKGQYIYHR